MYFAYRTVQAGFGVLLDWDWDWMVMGLDCLD